MSRLPGDEDSIAAQIQAEIADHLATAAEDLESHGIDPDAARQTSRLKFGDPAVITRRCYWIKQGDTLMFRTAILGILVVLCLALGWTTIYSVRTQRQMSEQMAALAEQLQAVAAQKVAAGVLPPAEPKPLEISGRAFMGSPDKPASNIRITIIDVKDASHVRSIETDALGNFKSGPLGGGDYSLLASTADRPAGGRYGYYVQSAPIGVYPGVSVPEQAFDVSYPVGGFSVELSRDLLCLNVDDRFAIDARLMIRVQAAQHRSDPWTTEVEPPLAWPVYPNNDLATTSFGRGTSRRNDGQSFFDLLSNDNISRRFAESAFGSYAARLPAGQVEVRAAILADILPIGYEPRPLPEFEASPASNTNNRLSEDERSAIFEWGSAGNHFLVSDKPLSLPVTGPNRRAHDSLASDSFYWMTKGLGNVWLTHLRGPEQESKVPRPHLLRSDWLNICETAVVPIERGKTTKLRIEVPEDLESRLIGAVDSTTDPDEFQKLVVEHRPGTSRSRDPRESPFFRPVRISLAAAGE